MWGDELSIAAAAERFQKNVFVFRVDEPMPRLFTPRQNAATENIFIEFDEVREHYDPLVPRKQVPESQSQTQKSENTWLTQGTSSSPRGASAAAPAVPLQHVTYSSSSLWNDAPFDANSHSWLFTSRSQLPSAYREITDWHSEEGLEHETKLAIFYRRNESHSSVHMAIQSPGDTIAW